MITDAELTELRYSGRGVLFLRTLKAIYYGTIVNCFFLAMVLIAAVRIAEVFLPWHLWMPGFLYKAVLSVVTTLNLNFGTSVTGLPSECTAANGLISILLIVIFVLLYSTVGGLRAVVATDVMQFLFIMIGTTVYAVMIVVKIGGLNEIGPRIVDFYGKARSTELLALMPEKNHILYPFLLLLGIQGLFWISSDGTGYLAQRSMACRSDHDARIAGIVLSWIQIIIRSMMWLIIGVGLLVLYPFTPDQTAAEGFAAARELTFITGIKDLLPVGLRGFMITGILAVISMLGAVGITFFTPETDPDILKNFYQKVHPPGWWKHRGSGSRNDILELRRRLLFTIIMSVSMFLILTGLIRIVIPLNWISPFWTWGTFTIGIALILLWWPSLKSKNFNNH